MCGIVDPCPRLSLVELELVVTPFERIDGIDRLA